ncbi:MAG: nucleoside triphosphate pyrophosphatase [Spongiibacteraceae bacterium]
MLSIILASSSLYRRRLLEQLGLTFDWASPDIDETPLPAETPEQLVHRLAHTKAQALATRFPQHWIIGSDQAASFNNRILGKPGTIDNARQQLRDCRGQRVEFLTGLCLLNSHSGESKTIVERFSVVFRELTDAQIDRYLQREQPFDCAGSFKVEGLGIALFERLEGDDPNALIGLPLIRLVTLLKDAGIDVI